MDTVDSLCNFHPMGLKHGGQLDYEVMQVDIGSRLQYTPCTIFIRRG